MTEEELWRIAALVFTAISAHKRITGRDSADVGIEAADAVVAAYRKRYPDNNRTLGEER